MKDERWIDINEAEHAGEQAALDYLRINLPDTEPYRAWASFEFPQGGKYRQVDSLVVGPKAIFLVEIKSWNGAVYGDEMQWRQLTSHNEKHPDNPRIWATEKARWLKGKLERTPTFKNSSRRVPEVVALVFMAGNDFTCRLESESRTGIAGYDPELMPEGARQGGGLEGILKMIRRWETRNPVNAEMSRMVEKAMSEIGIRPSRRFQTVGKAVLDEKIGSNSQADYWSAHDEELASNRYTVTFHKRVGVTPGGMERAERAARREYELLSSAEMKHPGLPVATDYSFDHPRGPAVVFALDPEAVALDAFLAGSGRDLGGQEQVDLVRRLAEALLFAHDQRMFHRALRPKVVMIGRSSSGHWQPVITGWHTGLRAEAEEGGPGAVSGTTHVSIDDRDALRYRAPETLDAQNPSHWSADVFSLGALTYLILSGEAPPEDLLGASEEQAGFLDIATADPSIPDDLRAFVAYATEEDPDKRIPTVEEFLKQLGQATSEARREPEERRTDRDTPSPETVEPAGPLDPDEVREGLRIGHFEVTRRLAEGSSGVAAIATRSDGQIGVLKISTSEQNDPRIEAEGRALATVQSRTVIGLIEGPVELRGRSAIFIQEAGGGTLRERLADGNPLEPEDVFRWGEDILGALEDMERFDLLHRDIKPENVGLIELPTGEQAVLLDLSLASAPLDELTLGTAPYREPFLGDRPDRTVDSAADRYSAAVLLHELLTGETPLWGDGTKAPKLCDLVLKEPGFPKSFAAGLASFFHQALNKDLGKRFKDAKQMRRAWEDSFVSKAPAPIAKPATAELILGAEDERLTVAFATSSRRFGEMLERLRAIPGSDRHFDRNAQQWLVKPTDEVLNVIAAMCATYEFSATDEATALLRGAGEPSPESPTPRPARADKPAAELNVGVEDGRLTVTFANTSPRFAEMLELIRAVPASERRFDPETKMWLTSTRESALGVIRYMCATYPTSVSDEASRILGAQDEAGGRQGSVDTPARPVPASTSAPALIIDSMGGKRLKIMFRDRTGQVSNGDVQDLDDRLSEVPKSQRTYVAPRRQWQLKPTPETAALIMELAGERECRIRSGAQVLIDQLLEERPDLRDNLPGAIAPPEAPAQPDSADETGGKWRATLGEFTLIDTGQRSKSRGTPAGAGEPLDCEQRTYELEGPEGLLLTIVDEEFENGERQIRVGDAYGSGPRFEELTGRLRLGVLESAEGLRIDLAQGRIKDPETNPNRGGMYQATAEELDAAAGVSVLGELRALGATDLGTRAEIVGDTSGRRNFLCAAFPASATHLPAAAYVMIRVAPIYQRLPK
jgi:serine/threonine protein kinase